MQNKIKIDNATIAYKQWLLAFVIGIIVIGVLTFICYFLFKPNSTKILKDKSEPADFQYPLNPAKLKTKWQDEISYTVNLQQEKTNKLEESLEAFNNIKEKQTAIMLTQEQEIATLKQKLAQLEASVMSEAVSPDTINANLSDNFSDSEVVSNKFEIKRIELATLTSSKQLPKTFETYVPAGSFVKAILLGGLDAHASVTSSSDPHPVLLRVLDTGTMPNNKQSKLNHCLIIGAGYGDVSSERAYIRLERMSCEQKGIFTDYPVFGYVTGSDGKDGIKGKVVLRDKGVVTRAFLGGFLSGLSDTAIKGVTVESISPLGSVETVKGQDALAASGITGVGNAMELYANYNIKRAEQYQPVVEIPSGTKVNIVFNKGFYLDGLTQKEADKLPSSDSHADFLLTYQEDQDENSNLLSN